MNIKLIACALVGAALAACQPNGSDPGAETAQQVQHDNDPAIETPSAATSEQAAPMPVDQLIMAATDAGIASQEGVAALEGDALVSSGSAGFLMYGPYRTFAAGKYVATIKGSIESAGSGEIIFDVTSQGKTFGQEVVSKPKPTGPIANINFELAETTPNIEVRARAGEGAQVRITGYKIVRQN